MTHSFPLCFNDCPRQRVRRPSRAILQQKEGSDDTKSHVPLRAGFEPPSTCSTARRPNRLCHRPSRPQKRFSKRVTPLTAALLVSPLRSTERPKRQQAFSEPRDLDKGWTVVYYAVHYRVHERGACLPTWILLFTDHGHREATRGERTRHDSPQTA